MKTWTISDMDGNTIISGDVRGQRRLVMDALRQGLSFARANLAGMNLGRLDLTGIDLRGACLDGADLRGSILKDADMSGASLTSVRAEGACFDSSRMNLATMDRSIFTGAGLAFADLRGAVIKDCSFDGVSAASSRFTGAAVSGSSFVAAEMQNVDFRYARLVECNFDRAKLGHRAFGTVTKEDIERLSKHLPDRTLGACIVGCTYQGAEMSDTVRGMRTDQHMVKATRFSLWCASTFGIVTAIDKSTELFSELLHMHEAPHLLAGGLIVVIAAATLLHERLVERLRAPAESTLRKLVHKVRGCMQDSTAVMSRKWDMVCVLGRRSALTPLGAALRASQGTAVARGFMSDVQRIVMDTGDVLLCDRRHLALALSVLCSAREEGMPLQQDVSLVHCDSACRPSVGPSVIRLLKDGCSTSVWPVDGPHGYLTVTYGRDGEALSILSQNGTKAEAHVLPEHALTRAQAILAFQASLLAHHDLHDFSYDHQKYRVDEGRHGALLVRRRSNGRIGNASGMPAIIPTEGEPVYMRNGSLVSP